MCLLLTLLFFGPRTAIALWWLTTPERWERAYDSFLVPFLGFLVLPWTTLSYVVVEPSGVDGLDVLWLALAFLLDVASLAGGGGYGRRRAIS